MNHLLGLQHRRQYLVIILVITRYCLTDSFYSLYLPRASPPCSSPLAQIASKSDTLRLVQPYRLVPFTRYVTAASLSIASGYLSRIR